MKKLQIGAGLKVDVLWYDKVPEPPVETVHQDCEVVGWRVSQVLLRIPGYAVIRCWKKSGLEVGNKDHARRGFRVELSQLTTAEPPPKDHGLDINIGE
jgi:hypothetical protein